MTASLQCRSDISLHDRRFMSQAGRTRCFARSATRARSARRGEEKYRALYFSLPLVSRSPCLAHKAPVMQATAIFIELVVTSLLLLYQKPTLDRDIVDDVSHYTRLHGFTRLKRNELIQLNQIVMISLVRCLKKIHRRLTRC